MSGKEKTAWPIYIFIFLALWSLNLLVDLIPKLPLDFVKHAARLDGIRAGFVAGLLYMFHVVSRRDAARRASKQKDATLGTTQR